MRQDDFDVLKYVTVHDLAKNYTNHYFLEMDYS